MITDGVITLRAPEPDDVDAIFRWENDRSQWMDSAVRAPHSRQAVWEFVTNCDNDIFSRGEARFVIELNKGRTPVGALDLTSFDALNRRAEVGICVDRAYRQSGYAARALSLMCGYAYTELGLHQLWAVTSVDNPAGRALFVKCGFKVSGRLKSWIRKGESYGDAYIYQRLLVNGR